VACDGTAEPPLDAAFTDAGERGASDAIPWDSDGRWPDLGWDGATDAIPAVDAALDGGVADSGASDTGSPGDTGYADADPPDDGLWRSTLYPEEWTPSHSLGSRFLHDFSYAGYKNSEVAPTTTSTIRLDVTTFGADPTGAADSTSAVQDAIDAAPEGSVVYFPTGEYRFDGRLNVRTSSVVLAGDGSTASRLYFTQHQNMAYGSHITVSGQVSHDLELTLAADAESRATTVFVEDASQLAIGDDIAIGWVITSEFIRVHGMTGTWQAFNDDWQAFFRRQVIAVDTSTTPHAVHIDVPLRYPAWTRDQASIRREHGYLTDCGVEGLGLANAVGWSDAWAQNQIHALELRGVADCWVRDVASFASPGAPSRGRGAGTHLQSGGIVVRGSKRVTVADSSMEKPENRGGGGNGYLFEVRTSSEILFRDCVAKAGRHNFIQNWGFGATGIVWLRVHSEGGVAALSEAIPFGQVGYSEFHHSLATANLIDSSQMDDGWSAVNRGSYSSGAGHSATENVLWNTVGAGTIRSFQFRHGYVVGTAPTITVRTNPVLGEGDGANPDDWHEGIGEAATLEPQSLFEDQLRRRLGR